MLMLIIMEEQEADIIQHVLLIKRFSNGIKVFEVKYVLGYILMIVEKVL